VGRAGKNKKRKVFIMVGIWILVICTGLAALGLGGWLLYNAIEERPYSAGWIIGLIITLIICAAIIWGSLFWLYKTEAGARAIKSYESNTQGGITRVVRVYDINGQLIDEYYGKFDIEYNTNRIIFDDENGYRHIIYYNVCTVIIDEIPDGETYIPQFIEPNEVERDEEV
jgi:hypothetical protein